jgi:sialate O-acetylesterase
MPRISYGQFSRFSLAILFGISIGPNISLGEVKLAAVLSDHMVVQRDLPVHIWGMAAVAETVSASFRGQSQSTVADELGRWSLYFSPGEAGGPFQLTVRGTNIIDLSDILVGDVWVASGQSNMEFPMTQLTDAQTEIATARNPRIRLLHVDHNPSDYPLENITAKLAWTDCNPESVADFSAVAYFFGRNLQQKIGVPIGLIESSWGGTPAESWTSLHALSADASLMPVFAARSKIVDTEATTILDLQREDREFERAVAQARAEGKPAPGRPWHPDFQAWAPSALFNGMIAPLTVFGIRGVIWYQGESNTGPERGFLYSHLFPAMISDWRRVWGEGDFPFLFVQIANWSSDPKDDWPQVRNAQRTTLSLKNTGMAVTIDIGDPVDIHPKNKQVVGQRLALAARAIAYGEKIEYSGPLLRQVVRDNLTLRIWFDHASRLTTKGGDVVRGFEIAGADGKFFPADAKIDGTTVIVSSPSVVAPVSVRYGWASNPDCNLYNGEGLPASPFQSTL